MSTLSLPGWTCVRRSYAEGDAEGDGDGDGDGDRDGDGREKQDQDVRSTVRKYTILERSA
jgi:hypothetical protein